MVKSMFPQMFHRWFNQYMSTVYLQRFTFFVYVLVFDDFDVELAIVPAAVDFLRPTNLGHLVAAF